ncbi:hypothetical protein HPB49_001215 [Dermacentor silvarum]|uniref:Uncharacterized protein n=1 Tax=Dermacentor silvarum TaxID=543639 RepID=A0ACB8DSW5_DERSI|nr:hypothetical protein HPB49_001215 [Dermacentor silvarum]
MPQLPNDNIRIIIRSRGRLHIARVGPTVVTNAIATSASLSPVEQHADTLCPNNKQNISVASTPKRENTNRYLRVKQICIAEKTYEVSAYDAAPHSTCKGVIRGIPVQDRSADIDAKHVNDRNPLALAAKRIGNTTAVIVALDGNRVPNFVQYRSVLLQCTLYRRRSIYATPAAGPAIARTFALTPETLSAEAVLPGTPIGSTSVHQNGSFAAELTSLLTRHVKRNHIAYVVRRRRWERASLT